MKDSDEHPALYAFRTGLVPILQELGFKEGPGKNYWFIETDDLIKGVQLSIHPRYGDFSDSNMVTVKRLVRLVDKPLGKTQTGRVGQLRARRSHDDHIGAPLHTDGQRLFGNQGHCLAGGRFAIQGG